MVEERRFSDPSIGDAPPGQNSGAGIKYYKNVLVGRVVVVDGRLEAPGAMRETEASVLMTVSEC